MARSVRAESRSKIIDGVLRALSSMETYLGLMICSSIFVPCEELAVSLQNRTMAFSAAVAGANILRHRVGHRVCKRVGFPLSPVTMRTEEKFSAIYAQTQQAMEQMNLDKPAPDS